VTPLTKRSYGVPLLILAAGLALRLPTLNYSFYGDEHFSLLRDSARLLTDSEDRFRPLFFSLLYLWKQLGFSGEVGLRLLPLLFGLAQIPVAYLVGRRLAGERLARVLAVLVATSPLLVEFSLELRMYSLVALLALGQILAWLRLLERDTPGRWLVFGLLGLLGVYTHLHYWIFLAGFVLTFLRERKALPVWKAFLTLAGVVILYLPNIPNLLYFAKVRGGEYIAHLPSALPKLLAAVTVGFNYFDLPDTGVGRPVGLSAVSFNLPLFVLAIVPAIVILWALIRLHGRTRRTSALWLGHELFTVPMLLALIITAVTGQYWLQPKYLIFTAPVALLLIAQAYLALDSVWLRRATALLTAVVCLIAWIRFWTPQQHGRRENWRQAAAVLRREITPRSTFLLAGSGYYLLKYYWPEAPQHWQLMDVRNTPSSSACRDSLLLRVRGDEDVYYLWYDIKQNVSDPRNLLLHSLDGLAARVDSEQFNPRLKLYHAWLPNAGNTLAH
jgi:4-amino-4-deoxy-L-arabinose transferase-like glycosyltransferase